MGNPFRAEQRVLRTPLPPESCRERLRARVGSIWNPFSSWSHPVRGRVTEKGFWIEKSIHYRNSFQTVAKGRWIPEGNGTRIDVTLGMNRFVTVFVLAWLVAVGGVGVMWWVIDSPATDRRPESAPALVAAIPFLMLLFGVALVAFGRWLSRNEAPELIEFLIRELDCIPDATPIQ